MTQPDSSNLRIAFAGSPHFAEIVLHNLMAAGLTPIVVYTQPDRPQGRGRRLQANPVKLSAAAAQLPVEQPTNLRGADAALTLANYDPDVLVVVAYGLILPIPILEVPPFGCLNVHASLLPRWRGAAPIERAYMAGDEKTGACIMLMDEGLDTGPVYKCSEVPIADNQSIEALELQLAEVGSKDLIDVLQTLALAKADSSQAPTPTAQTELGANYAGKLTSRDRVLDFELSAIQLARQINALAARMPVRCRFEDKPAQLLAATVLDAGVDGTAETNGTIIGLTADGLAIQCAIGQLLIKQLKFEGGKGTVLDGKSLVNGFSTLLTNGTVVN
ncbi:MAG: methionyl-tRNA formyltransferase [Pseudomonadales bacterium]|nr:methionyl-tRNA formyltransferase [Pseudomonadales bacterium]